MRRHFWVAALLLFLVAPVSTTAAHQRPDLKPQLFSVTPPSAEPGATVLARVVIKNQGTRTAGSSVVLFQLDSTPLKTVSVGLLAPGATTDLTVSLTLPSSALPGVHTQTAIVDSANQIREHSESNNRIAFPFTVSAGTPPPSGRFETLPPGSVLPSGSDCASRIQRASWEPRPDNTVENYTNVYAQGARLTGSYLSALGLPNYEQRVTGDFTGTTDEILQWGACKWGLDEDIVRAQAVSESYWKQSQLGDCRGGTVPETNGCQSVGILQVKGANLPPTHPGTWPYAWQSTAFNVDYTYAVWRACFEGKETWLGSTYRAGDVWGCVGRWFSGDWYVNSGGYIASVKGHLANKEWFRTGF